MQYYEKKYFDWQKRIGAFGGKANLFKFKDYIKGTSDVLDFGCGGGYLLSNINTQGKKIGVDINPSAREEASKKGIECYENLKQVEDNSVDVVISNHAIEHVENPSEIIREMIRVTRHAGTIVIVVPHEVSKRVRKNDVNMHISTFCPQNIYNLFRSSGLTQVKAKRLCHFWMPGYIYVQRIVGWKGFHFLCRLYGLLTKGYQSVGVGVVDKSLNIE